MVVVKMFFLFFLPALLLIASIGVNLYMVHRDLVKVLDNFKKSTIVSSYGDIWGRGSIHARYTLVNIIAGIFMFADKHIRKGVLDREELDSLPGDIRLRMRLYVGFVMSSVLCFLLVAIVLAILKETKCCKV